MVQVRDRLGDLYELRRRIEAEIRDLERRQARAARLPQPRKPKPPPPPLPAADVPSPLLRQWAREHDIPVSDRARIPRRIREQYAAWAAKQV